MGRNNKKKSSGHKPVNSLCKKCSSPHVVESQSRSIEGLIKAIIPCNVHRCLDCYHRFWAFESLFSNASRVWVLVFVSLIVVTSVFFSVQQASQSNLNRKAEFIPFETSEPNSLESNSLGSNSETAQVDSDDADVGDVGNIRALLKDADIVESNEPDTLLKSVIDSAGEVEVIEAKFQSEKIISKSEESIKRLESAVDEDQQALASLLKVDINYRIEGWRKSWQAGLVNDYLSFYSPSFKPNNGLSNKAWQAQRKLRVSPSKKITLSLSDFDVEVMDENKRAVAIFTQSYSSPTYSEVSRKKLVLLNEEGNWNISSEEQVE